MAGSVKAERQNGKMGKSFDELFPVCCVATSLLLVFDDDAGGDIAMFQPREDVVDRGERL
jgi:hypothetical protein